VAFESKGKMPPEDRGEIRRDGQTVEEALRPKTYGEGTATQIGYKGAS